MRERSQPGLLFLHHDTNESLRPLTTQWSGRSSRRTSASKHRFQWHQPAWYIFCKICIWSPVIKRPVASMAWLIAWSKLNTWKDYNCMSLHSKLHDKEFVCPVGHLSCIHVSQISTQQIHTIDIISWPHWAHSNHRLWALRSLSAWTPLPEDLGFWQMTRGRRCTIDSQHCEV